MTIPTLVSSYSVHDYHSFGIHGTGHTNGLHFHLAATINAQTGTFLFFLCKKVHRSLETSFDC